MSGIPQGFEPITRLSPFNALVGPLYQRRRANEGTSIGLQLEEKHANSRGMCHGGVLATLADLALGYAMLDKTGKSGFVTAHLSVDYAGSARPGDWVQSEVEIHKVGARLAFANCYLVVRGQRIASASAIFAFTGGE